MFGTYSALSPTPIFFPNPHNNSELKKENYLVLYHLILQHSIVGMAYLFLVTLCIESTFSIFKQASRVVDSIIHSVNKICQNCIDLTRLWNVDSCVYLTLLLSAHVMYHTLEATSLLNVTSDDMASIRHPLLMTNLIELKGNSRGFSMNMAIL